MSASDLEEFKTIIYRLAHLAGTHYLEISADMVARLGGSYHLRL